ncbi:hypothetical protein [Halobacteriovorax sp. HLS]|uniref:hypothetical protein n=1 Tax=Halobacteriovorax sp. HLS TaxID=2234000 RepID=UPI000FD9CAEE|nr:hypothetical protein [Halobacteriovorax sp. HLS]
MTKNKVKILLVLIMTLYTSQTLAGSNKHTNWMTFIANTESEAVEMAQEIATQILNAEIIEVISFGRRHDCEFRVRRDNGKKIRIRSLDIDKHYSFEANEFRPYFKAQLFYQFTKCRKERTRRY